MLAAGKIVGVADAHRLMQRTQAAGNGREGQHGPKFDTAEKRQHPKKDEIDDYAELDPSQHGPAVHPVGNRARNTPKTKSGRK